MPDVRQTPTGWDYFDHLEPHQWISVSRRGDEVVFSSANHTQVVVLGVDEVRHLRDRLSMCLPEWVEVEDMLRRAEASIGNSTDNVLAIRHLTRALYTLAGQTVREKYDAVVAKLRVN